MKSKYVIIFLLLVAVAAGTYVGVAYYLEQARQSEFWVEEIILANEEELDSAERAGAVKDVSANAQHDIKDDGLARREILHSVQNDRTGGYDNGDDDDEEEARSHPGTSPDDPMFGFDYWDDEDDAYEVERNQTDAYPDEW